MLWLRLVAIEVVSSNVSRLWLHILLRLGLCCFECYGLSKLVRLSIFVQHVKLDNDQNVLILDKVRGVLRKAADAALLQAAVVDEVVRF